MNSAERRQMRQNFIPKKCPNAISVRVFVHQTFCLDNEHAMIPCPNLRNREYVNSLAAASCGEKQLRVCSPSLPSLANPWEFLFSFHRCRTIDGGDNPPLPPVARQSAPCSTQVRRSRRQLVSSKPYAAESCDFHSDSIQLPP